jgi:hypothetical protein
MKHKFVSAIRELRKKVGTALFKKFEQALGAARSGITMISLKKVEGGKRRKQSLLTVIPLGLTSFVLTRSPSPFRKVVRSGSSQTIKTFKTV